MGSAPRKPFLIGIAGPSGSGKTSVASDLGRALPSIQFSLDHYYLDLSNIPQSARGARNFDHPDSLDGRLIVEHITTLADAMPIERPVYDFRTHCRTGKTDRIEPAEFIIVEGLFTLHYQELRPLYGLKVFIDAGKQVCLKRRTARDVAERGRTEESVLQQFQDTVQPMAEQFVLPTRQYADLVLSGDEKVSANVDRILELVKGRLVSPK